MLILIVGSPLVSRAENTILLTCVGLIGKENRIVHIVVLENINSTLQMQVKIDSTTVYVKNVTRSTLPDRIGFTGEFSEISYLPQIEMGSVVVCR
ncbi:hypothetical protein [Leptospira interrogans]|uniref:hypothetical protein n=1 Tax=Leptospira interrogans TaxID=173 RepID=UPI00046C8829|nr:hypothetical protein [Leptospira interrogans]